MRCLLIVGSSQTQWYTAPSGDTVFTRGTTVLTSRAPQPFDGLIDRAHRPHPGRQRRAVDHHHRHTQIAGGGQLGLGEPSPLFLVTSTSIRLSRNNARSSS